MSTPAVQATNLLHTSMQKHGWTQASDLSTAAGVPLVICRLVLSQRKHARDRWTRSRAPQELDHMHMIADALDVHWAPIHLAFLTLDLPTFARRKNGQLFRSRYEQMMIACHDLQASGYDQADILSIRAHANGTASCAGSWLEPYHAILDQMETFLHQMTLATA